MERANVISKLRKGVDLNIVKKVENKYGKLTYCITKDAIKKSKVSNIEEIFPNNYSTILSETHDQKWHDTRIKSLETVLARKDDIIYNMSKYFHNINSHNVPCKTHCNDKGKTSSKKNDNVANPVVESNMKKLEDQLIDVRKKYKERYYKDHFVKIKDIPINNPSNALDDLIETNSENNYDVNPKGSLKDSETKNSSIDNAVIYKKIKKKSVVVVGDSLLNGIEESKLSKDRHIRVQPISGAKIKDISKNLDELIHNDLKTIILHVGTNNTVEDTPEDIYNDLISLKTKIEDKIPNCQVLISCLIRRSDNVKANKTAEKVNNFIKLAS